MKIKIQKLTENDFTIVSRFIANLNGAKETHITEAGIDPKDIEQTIKFELPDIPAAESFLLAFEESQLIAVWGFEVDMERGVAYLWGPFIEHSNWHEVAAILWPKLLEIIPSKISSIRLNPSAKNTNAVKFAEQLNFETKSEALLLEINKENHQPFESERIVELNKTYEANFVSLHDTIFPDTYYDGQEILERLNEYRKVFITNDFSGYVYADIQINAGTAEIEFIGVKESERGKGLGQLLLKKALDWIFMHQKMNKVSLYMQEDNPAIKLYKKVGFRVEDKAYSFNLNL